MEKKVRKIIYTQARNSIQGSFEMLADKEVQEKEWIDSNYAHSFWDSIWFYGLDTLVESFRLHRDAYKWVGEILYDEEEASIIQEYCAWLLELVDYDIGPELSDSRYYNHPEWKNVIERALKIRKLMARKNKENGFWREFNDAENEPYEEGQDLTPEDEKKYLD